MIKYHGMLRGSGAGLAAVIQMDASARFLLDRQEVVDLTPVVPASKTAYVWRRLFLTGKGHRA